MPTVRQRTGQYPGDPGAAMVSEVQALLSNRAKFKAWAKMVVDGAGITGLGVSTSPTHPNATSPIETYLRDFGVDDAVVGPREVTWKHNLNHAYLPGWAVELTRAFYVQPTGDSVVEFMKERGLV